MARVTKIKAPKFTGPNNTTRIKPGQARRKKPGSGKQVKLPGGPAKMKPVIKPIGATKKMKGSPAMFSGKPAKSRTRSR